MIDLAHAIQDTLPEDAADAALAGRIWRPDVGGPSVVALRGGAVIDVSATFPTMRDLCEADDPAAALRAAEGGTIGDIGPIQTAQRPQLQRRAGTRG